MSITRPYKGGVKFIARVLREQAGLWIKDRNSAARQVKFRRNFGAKQRELNLKFAAQRRGKSRAVERQWALFLAGVLR